jgi:hypothetical protein
VALVALSACGWFRSKPAVPAPTQFLVTGAPAGSIVFVDGTASGEPNPQNGHPQVIDVAPGPHSVEIHLGDTVLYHEDTDALAHRKTLVRVLSGSGR